MANQTPPAALPTCPTCGRRYVATTRTCGRCGVSLWAEGHPVSGLNPEAVVRDRAGAGRAGERASRWVIAVLWLAGLSGLLAVTGAAFGLPWVAAAFGIGVGTVVLGVLLFGLAQT